MQLYTSSLSVPCPPFIGDGSWVITDISEITVLFGKNGSGKSLFLRKLRDQNIDGYHYVVPERTGELGFQPSFLETQTSSEQRRQSTSKNFLSDYRRQIIARIQAYFFKRGSSRTTEMHVPPGELEELLSILIPDFSIVLKGSNPPYDLTRVSSNTSVSNIDELSSGEAQMLTIGLDILTIAAIWELENAPIRLLLVDEPDAHIHPDLQARFADFIIKVGDAFKLQIILATHSTTLLAALGQFGGEKTSVIYFDRTKLSFSAKQFTSILKEVAACLGGHALMGPLFGVPLLLVEGDDDYRIWSQVPRHHVVNFSVIPSSGEEIFEYQKILEQIFSSLRTAGNIAGYALLDGDKSLPETSVSNPQTHVKFVGLQCHEAENLYLTDEVLNSMGLNWADVSLKIQTESSNYGNKATALADAPNWDRKTADVKILINEISKIIDPKCVHWTIRVGSTIGRVRPNGQLASFLGVTLIDSLWGPA